MLGMSEGMRVLRWLTCRRPEKLSLDQVETTGFNWTIALVSYRGNCGDDQISQCGANSTQYSLGIAIADKAFVLGTMLYTSQGQIQAILIDPSWQPGALYKKPMHGRAQTSLSMIPCTSQSCSHTPSCIQYAFSNLTHSITSYPINLTLTVFPAMSYPQSTVSPSKRSHK